MTINYNAALEEYCGIPKTVWDPEGSIKSFSLSRNTYNPMQAALFEGKCEPQKLGIPPKKAEQELPDPLYSISGFK